MSDAGHKDVPLPEMRSATAAIDLVIEGVLREWKRDKPEEYAAYRQECDDKRKSLRRDGWSETEELYSPYVLPTYVLLRIGQKIGDPGWWSHDEKALEALIRALPCSRMNPDVGVRSSVWCDAERRRRG